jgi:hypothetical protein
MERKDGLAVLIDADNVQAAALPAVLDHIAGCDTSSSRARR